MGTYRGRDVVAGSRGMIHDLGANKPKGEIKSMPRRRKLDFRIDENGCFVLTSHRLNGEGYGYLYSNGKGVRAHRFVYQECFGNIPHGIVVRHKCDNRGCINPEHLQLGTQSENMRDAVSRRRTAHGERNGRAVLTEETARKIKTLIREGATTKEIMQEMGVKRHVVRRIREKRSWRYVE